jgi:hypothetical protein
MRCEFVTSDTGRRGAEITVDGAGDITVWKKRVTRHDAQSFDDRIQALSDKLIKLSKSIGKAKGDARRKIADEIFDANAEFICARVDGVTPEQLAAIDVTDVAEISNIANKLFSDTFEAKKND